MRTLLQHSTVTWSLAAGVRAHIASSCSRAFLAASPPLSTPLIRATSACESALCSLCNSASATATSGEVAACGIGELSDEGAGESGVSGESGDGGRRRGEPSSERKRARRSSLQRRIIAGRIDVHERDELVQVGRQRRASASRARTACPVGRSLQSRRDGDSVRAQQKRKRFHSERLEDDAEGDTRKRDLTRFVDKRGQGSRDIYTLATHDLSYKSAFHVPRCCTTSFPLRLFRTS
eukprot:6182407-Pleurochrysis_carterae.AAC.3